MENLPNSLYRETVHRDSIEYRANYEEGTKEKTAGRECRSAASTNSSLNKMASPIVALAVLFRALSDTRSLDQRNSARLVTLVRQVKERIDLKDYSAASKLFISLVINAHLGLFSQRVIVSLHPTNTRPRVCQRQRNKRIVVRQIARSLVPKSTKYY